MCAYVLLNILNESGKRDICEACRVFNLFFSTEHVRLQLNCNSISCMTANFLNTFC